MRSFSNDDRDILKVYYPDPGKIYKVPQHLRNRNFTNSLFFTLILFFLIFSAFTMSEEAYRPYTTGVAVFVFLTYIVFTFRSFQKKPEIRDEYQISDLLKGSFYCPLSQNIFFELLWPMGILPILLSFPIHQSIFLIVPDVVLLILIVYRHFFYFPKRFSIDDGAIIRVQYYNREVCFNIKDISSIRLYNSIRYKGIKSGPLGIIFTLNTGKKVHLPIHRTFSGKYGIQVPGVIFEFFFRDLARQVGFKFRSTHKNFLRRDGWYTF